jgi:hypothetical protein
VRSANSNAIGGWLLPLMLVVSVAAGGSMNSGKQRVGKWIFGVVAAMFLFTLVVTRWLLSHPVARDRSPTQVSELTHRSEDQWSTPRSPLDEQSDQSAMSTGPAVGAKREATEGTSLPQMPLIERPKRFSVAGHTKLSWNETIVTGGWLTGPERRALLFIQPEGLAENVGFHQIQLRCTEIQVPDHVFRELGLESLTTDADEAQDHGEVFGSRDAALLLKDLMTQPATRLLMANEFTAPVGGLGSLEVGAPYGGPNAVVSIMNALVEQGASLDIEFAVRISTHHP